MPTSRRAAKVVLCATLAALLAAVTVSPAHAWTWNQWATVYNGSDFCVQGHAGIDHARPGALSGNLAYANTFARNAGCGAGLANRTAAVRLDVYKLDGPSWVICRSTDWTYGTTGIDQWGPTGPEQALDYGGSTSCGPGHYQTRGHSYVWDGSAWRGGSIWSGAELVP